jgi:hypothetical protein
MKKNTLYASIAILIALFLSACAGAVAETPAVSGDAGGTLLAQPQTGVETQAQANGDAPKQGGRGGFDLTAAAEALGVTVEELQQALQDAIPAECAPTNGQPVDGINCRPDLTVAAESLGVTAEELQAALGKAGKGNRGERDLTAAAEALGVTVEELQQAFQDARPEECAEGQPVQGVDCRADLDTVATSLGVTTEELQSALGFGERGPDITAIAEALGVTEEELQQALEDAKPEGCVEGQQPAEGVDCHPDFETIAASLGVTTEEVQTAFQESFRGGRGDGHSKGGRGGNGQQPPQGGNGGPNSGQQPPAPTQP